MAQSLSRILLHLVYSTYQRAPSISPQFQPRLYEYLGGVLEQNESRAIAIGGMPDHVHIFFLATRNRSVADIVRNLKVSSTVWLKSHDDAFADFRWQAGYGVFSVGESQSGTVAEYVRNQAQHHQKRGFQEELLALLKKYKVEYDERFLWD